MVRRVSLSILAVIFLLSGLPEIGAAQSAPIAWVEPPSGSPGTTFNIYVSGIPAYARLNCQVLGPDGQAIGLGPCYAEANGRGGLVTQFTTAEGYTPGGTYTVNFYDEAHAFVISTTFEVVLPERRCFTETGQCMQGRFLRYWYTHGGLPFNGYPLTGEFMERLGDGNEYQVQYFERTRLEYHPENLPPYDILLGQFGRYIHPLDPPVSQKANASYFPQTGHNVEGPFRNFLVGAGESGLGIEYFGYPISEAFEQRLEDGNIYTVQYFERARLEIHPEIRPGAILLGQFGRRILEESRR